jgi:hypothetical protein
MDPIKIFRDIASPAAKAEREHFEDGRQPGTQHPEDEAVSSDGCYYTTKREKIGGV